MNSRHYGFIDALRGYAILAVMGVHAASTASSWHDGFLHRVVDEGARGVQLFFVASALTLAMSWSERGDGVIPFYVRRLFRIAPLFWLGIGLFIWLDGWGPRYFAPAGISATDVTLTALFLHGWNPLTLNSVVPGGWSIAVEMSFYAIFPILVFFIRGLGSALKGLLCTLILAPAVFGLFWAKRALIWPGVSDSLISTLLTLWLPYQMPVFMVGFVVFFLFRDYSGRVPRPILRVALCGCIAAIPLLTFVNDLTIRGHHVGALLGYPLYAFCFGAFAFCLAEGVGRVMVNSAIRHLGKVSFSAYLIHFAVLHGSLGIGPLRSLCGSDGFLFFLIYFVFLAGLTTVLASITFRMIERPMVRLGNRVLDHFGSELPAQA